MNTTNPFDEIEQLFGRTSLMGDRAWGRDLRTADIDVSAYDDEFVVTADLPGFDREGIDVRVDDGRLLIAAERDAEHEDADRRYLRRERRHESVTRTVDLPASARADDASATYRNGVLTVTVPLDAHDADEGHRIDVN